MVFPIFQLVFYVTAALLIGSAVMVIVSRNPVRAILFLILAFFASAVLWMLLQAEFLALALIFVYVGAVMTLFLFVVMMLDIDLAPLKEGFVKYLPWGIGIMALFIALLVFVIGPKHISFASIMPTHYPADYSNTKELGTLLFTKYLFPLEVVGAILLVAMVSAIALAFHGRREGTKSQRISDQLKATKAERLRIVKMKGEGA